MKALLAVVCAVAFVAVLAGCAAEEEVENARDRLAERTERLRRDVEREYRRQRDKVEGRVQEYLAQLEQAIPSAEGTSPEVQVRGRSEPQEIDEFMEGVLRN